MSKLLKLNLIFSAFLVAACGGSELKEQAAVSEPVAVDEKPADKVLLDVQEIALKPKKQVELFLGAPIEPCEKGKYGLKCAYKFKDTSAEIVFIDDKADWITLQNPNFGLFDVPAQLGLSYEKATSQTRETIVYENAYGFNQMTVFVAGNKVDYVYIKAATP